MLLAGGLLLWQRKPLGYVCGAGLLLQYAVLALSVVPILLAEPRTSGTPVDVAGVAVLLVMTVVCLAPLAGFVRGASGRGSPPA